MLGFLFAVRDVPSSTERCLFTYASAACCIQTSMLNFRWLYVLASQTEETNSDFVNWLSIVSNLILGIYYYFEAYQQQKSFGIVVQRVTKTDVHLRASYRDWLLLQSLTSISIVLSMHIMAILAIFFFSDGVGQVVLLMVINIGVLLAVPTAATMGLEEHRTQGPATPANERWRPACGVFPCVESRVKSKKHSKGCSNRRCRYTLSVGGVATEPDTAAVGVEPGSQRRVPYIFFACCSILVLETPLYWLLTFADGKTLGAPQQLMVHSNVLLLSYSISHMVAPHTRCVGQK